METKNVFFPSIAESDEFRSAISEVEAGRPIPVVMAKVEAALLAGYLRQANGVIRAAAEAAGLPEPTFRKKMAKHGVWVRRVAVKVGVGDAA